MRKAVLPAVRGVQVSNICDGRWKFRICEMQGRLMFPILSGLAESESSPIFENEKWGIKRRFQNGTFIISYSPYSYANVDGEIAVVPVHVEIMKQIFADTFAGKVPTSLQANWMSGALLARKAGIGCRVPSMVSSEMKSIRVASCFRRSIRTAALTAIRTGESLIRT